MKEFLPLSLSASEGIADIPLSFSLELSSPLSPRFDLRYRIRKIVTSLPSSSVGPSNIHRHFSLTEEAFSVAGFSVQIWPVSLSLDSIWVIRHSHSESELLTSSSSEADPSGGKKGRSREIPFGFLPKYMYSPPSLPLRLSLVQSCHNL